MPTGCAYNSTSGDSCKDGAAYTDTEIGDFLTDGIANNPTLPWTPKGFSNDLVPNTPLGLASFTGGSFNGFRGTNIFHTWVASAPDSIGLNVSSGWQYSDRGPARIDLTARADVTEGIVDYLEAPPDKVTRSYTLDTTFEGMHTMVLNDFRSSTKLAITSGHPLTWEPTTALATYGRYSMYFYVPKGTTVVGGYAASAPTSPSPTILDSTGTVQHTVTAAGYFSVAVPAGQDGKIWKLNQFINGVELMTVPNLLARTTADLLLPSEVVDADQ